jgi:hypothetical protein
MLAKQRLERLAVACDCGADQLCIPIVRHAG